MRRILLTAVVLALCSAPAAFAGTVAVGPTAAGPLALTYTAAPGERNQVTLTLAGINFPYDIVVRDAAAAVVAGPGCLALDERAVGCKNPVIKPSFDESTLRVSIDAGDGDDTVTVPTAYGRPTSVYGGDGHDVLTGVGLLSGGPGDDVLTGGDSSLTGHKGNDPVVNFLAGGPGDDVLRGGRGEASFSGDGDGDGLTSIATQIPPDPGGGDDVMIGGPGGGSVSYQGRAAGVRVDLADTKGFDGAPGERDRIRAIVNVTGGDGDDVLLGDEARNDLRGGPGDDRLIGRAGSDDLTGAAGADVLDGRAGADDLDGGPGRDTLRGGAGHDDLLAGSDGDVLEGSAGSDSFLPRLARSLNCGSGHDIVATPKGSLLVGCESLLIGAVSLPASTDTLSIAARPQRRPGGGLRFAWSCNGTAGCDLRIKLLRGSTSIGSRRAVFPGRGDAQAIVIRPRRRLRGGQLVEVAVSGALYASQYWPWPTTPRTIPFSARWRIRL